MSLQFYFGASGSGKSRRLHEDIIQASKRHPETDYLLIVPDQFTMQTQMDLVVEHSSHIIMNIDVLSFGRLTHRILEEVGCEDVPVLDDTGKSLVLRKVAQQCQGQLKVMGSHLHKIGYIHEVKSAISEFMQYGIGLQEMEQLTEYARSRGALYHKLQDLGVLYRAFVEYIHEKFITTEETLDRLKAALPRSGIIRNSVIAFDGFTGFTPIQNRVIQELIRLAKKVIVTVTIDDRENPYQMDGEHKLFHLSKKTVSDLRRLAGQVDVAEDEAVWCAGRPEGRLPRFVDNAELSHLERNLFRYPSQVYEQEVHSLCLFEASTPKEEIRQTCIAIRKLLAGSTGLHYRDIAVVTGDMGAYGSLAEEEFAKFGIPIYLDHTRGILRNPFAEYIRSALRIVLQDFSYEAVFHYLRTGLTGFAAQDVDRLENYVRRFGIHGRKRWQDIFIYKEDGRKGEEAALAQLAQYNVMREGLLMQLAPLLAPAQTAGDLVQALYQFLVHNELQQKLKHYELQFKEQGDLARAKEYGQIYALVIDLLDQIYGLLAGEKMERREFADILDSGLTEISVGTIPQNVDRVLVGDIERTRLKQVKVLFFLGVNDGNIPKAASGGGIISDMDREFLRESELELAPSPRQQMYIQRFYLYLNMTKPSHRLYLSWCRVNSAGKSVRPAYLADVVRRLYPDITVGHPEQRSPLEQIVTGQEGLGYLAEGLREYAEGGLSGKKEAEFYTIYRVYGDGILGEKRNFLTDAAFRRYRDTGLSQAVARALYGVQLENSVTRLETYAACAYRHFLQYGLALKERGEFSFESVDMGNVYHAVLAQFAEKLTENQYTWFDFPEEFAAECVRGALERLAADYGSTVLYSSARNEYAITRMGRILTRTVLTLQKQLQKGRFRPDAFEISFQYADHLESVNVALSGQEKMHLQGRIDRIDVAEDEERLYVKVIDYKSGNKRFDLAALYYGLQLQLVVYMNAAMEIEGRRHRDREAVPAAMLYYHIDDPSVETPVELTPEEINEQIGEKLRMNGVVNSAPHIVEMLDNTMESKSAVIPVERKKDGSFSARSSVLSGPELKTVSDYVSRKIAEIGREILDGTISLNPYEKGSEEACTYCTYRKVCGFEASLPGCGKRKLEELDREEALRRMEE